MSRIAAFLVLVMVGFVMTSSSASAHPSPGRPPAVTFVGVQDGIPRSMDLYVTNKHGLERRQSIGTTWRHGEYWCPKNEYFRLMWTRVSQIPGREDGVRVHVMLPGECLDPVSGNYLVTVIRSPKTVRGTW
jgi:hypothetical protein